MTKYPRVARDMVVREYYDTKLAINEIYLLNFLNICTRMLKLYIFNKLHNFLLLMMYYETHNPPYLREISQVLL